ncbi:MAG TPA: glycoside hydrolase 43 family protein [Acidobacteriaceae bacterium]|nr:glycoside hydrolase 43 family protein [Acidobacteriaceae bacterium]
MRPVSPPPSLNPFRPRKQPGLFRVALLTLVFAFAALRPSIASDTKSAVYHNPVLYSDYSDPDIIRVADDFYLIASSFHFVPAIPILHSRDLVHWELAGHVLPRLTMAPQYDMQGGMRYGGGVWAPSVRAHNGLFYIYFPTPDEGIFVTTATKMTGPWSPPVAVLAGPGWEDPCPFWDDDGSAYLLHSKLHAGPLILHRMTPDGKKLLDAGKIIVQDPVHLPTLEGPKLYKRNGWYYIFAPMGGVGRGPQVVLRSRNIYGPYDYRIVLEQGNTDVNGPHQGGWIETANGGNWFIHFSLRSAHGRILYLEPVRWVDDWPVMGKAAPGATLGYPVAQYPMPLVDPAAADMDPQTSDEFNKRILGPNWEWNHNPVNSKWSLTERPGYLRLHAMPSPDLLHARNTLTENMQDESFEVTTRIDLEHTSDGGRAGLSIFDKAQSYIAISQNQQDRSLLFSADGKETPGPAVKQKIVQLRAVVRGDTAQYLYSLDDGRTFYGLGSPVTLTFSWWKGARPALFSFNTRTDTSNDGSVDIDWLHYHPLSSPPAVHEKK